VSVVISPVAGAVGAEVDGVDLRDVDAVTAETLRLALATHGVLFFRAQHLSDAEHVVAAEVFGPTELFEMAPVADHPLVHVVSSSGLPNRHGGATTWHSDATWHQCPPRGSMLRAVEVPDFGGDTLFASANGAYQTLSSGLQRMVDELSATHSGGAALERAGERVDRTAPPAVQHPVVRRHPVTGLPCLFVNRVFTRSLDGVPAPENNVLLPYLCDVVRDPELQCRFRWQIGDVAIWDNCAVQHYATPDHGGDRRMHRVVLAGDPVVAHAA
jgi:taurine dioxygenase